MRVDSSPVCGTPEGSNRTPSGRRVAQVYSGNLPKGLQIVSWSGTDAQGERVGRGIYFSKLVVGDDVRVARLVQTSP